jgi:hypothetical protein
MAIIITAVLGIVSSGANVVKNHGNLPWYFLFLGLKYGGKFLWYWVLFFLGPMLQNNTMIIKCHQMVITVVILLYNT